MSITSTPRRRRFGAAAILIGAVLVALGFLASPATAAPGNNGTVKVDGTDFDTHPNNQPHVGCVFQIDFYGFDANTTGNMTFEVHPPTGNEVIYTEDVVLDNDDASGGGSEAGLDGEFTVDLTEELAGFTPHDIQGYHVKLSVTTDDGDTIGGYKKHKTYWVGPCETTDDGGTDDTTTDTGDVGADDTTTTDTGAVENTDEEVLGEVVTPPATLPVTGAEDRSLMVLGAGLIAIGAVVLVTKRAVFVG